MSEEDKKIKEVKNKDITEDNTPIPVVDSPAEVREYLRDAGYIIERYSE